MKFFTESGTPFGTYDKIVVNYLSRFGFRMAEYQSAVLRPAELACISIL